MWRPDDLLHGLPARPRALAECVLLLVMVFVAPPAVAAFVPSRAWVALAAAVAVCGGAAVLLTRHHPPAALASVAGVALALWASGVHAPATPPRLGVQPVDTNGCAEVTRVVPGRPADGVIVAGDCITALGGQPLDAAAPSADLLARLRDERRTPRGAVLVTLRRAGGTRDVSVTLPAVSGPRLRGSDLPWLLLRSLGLVVLVAALLAGDGQAAGDVGLDRARAGRDLLWTFPVLVGAYATNVAASVPVALALHLLQRTGSETAQRIGALQGLSDVGFAWLVPSLVGLAFMEEVVFRAFLLPRARWLCGHWWLAVLLVQLLFGLGHVYEGAFAVFQTMMLGVYFSVVFLWRRHLAALIVAHAAFNTLTFALVLFLQRSGLLEKLPLPR
jgi:CAAX protease family protein